MKSSLYLTPRLRPSESVQWSGRPIPAWWLMRGWFYRVPFSLAWLMVSVSSYVGTHRWWLMLFLLFGLYIAAGRFLVEYIEAKGVVYAVTNQRVLIESRVLWYRRHWDYEISRLTDLGLSATASGVGTVFLSRSTNLLAWATWNREADYYRPLPTLTASPASWIRWNQGASANKFSSSLPATGAVQICGGKVIQV